ncbi:MAG TPA: PLDc N-terminal domain-containing protein, partial [Kineosporiaceae bacterium]|nr:PLDc N-terminal domain-containing protein [Kineosporiaceae bacterium]
MLELTAGLLAGAVLGLTVYCLVDSVQVFPGRVRGIPAWAWRLVILLPLAGPVAWLTLGRPQAGHRMD